MISLTLFFFVALVVMVENAVIPTDDTDNRILGGRDASIEEFPSMASLSYWLVDGLHICGATIISEKWILTAGHCVNGALASDILVTVGSAIPILESSIHRSSRIIIHEEYEEKRFLGSVFLVLNDIALIEVEKPFSLNNRTIKAGRLPLQDQDTPAGTIVTAAGWGRVEGDKHTYFLQKVNLEILSLQKCKPIMLDLDERNLCVGDSRRAKGVCRGDSGGPIFSNGVVVGITSTGDGSCKWPHNPSTFIRVAYFRDWIKQNTEI